MEQNMHIAEVQKPVQKEEISSFEPMSSGEYTNSQNVIAQNNQGFGGNNA